MDFFAAEKAISQWWHAERPRHFLWIPVAFAAGIALYFSLNAEPRLPAVLVVDAVVILLAGFAWRRARPWAVFLLIIAAGFSWSMAQTRMQHQVVVEEAMPPQWVEGTVEAVERTEHGFRVALSAVKIEHLSPERTPQKIRLTLRIKQGETITLPPTGSSVRLRAGLLPPMGPALPGGFDFARYFYFNGIGAVGYGLPPLTVVHSSTADSWWQVQRDGFWSWRARLTDRIVTTLGPHTGPVAAGLITGDARAITQDDFEDLRASNLYHIIAISGEHMVVISGVIFLLLRWMVLLLPERLRHLPQMKSLAAALTLALVTVYLYVTGLPVSAVRAYLMIALVLLAILLRRQVNPMRSLMIAGLLMLIHQPADLFDPGFQLSFAATVAIIAWVESWRNAVTGASRGGTILRGALAMILISVVAELATTPYVLSQFNMISAYGVAANTIATPLVSFFLMPLVALYFLLLPLGLSDVALTLMDYGIHALLWIAHTVAHWPYALWAFPSPPAAAMVAFTLALAWLCIFQHRARYLALPVMLVALFSPFTVRTPDVMIGAQLKQIAFRHTDGYVLARGRATSLIPKLWANGLGYTEFTELRENDPAWRCDDRGCVATVAARRIAFTQDAAALPEDCAMADVIVTTQRLSQPCRGKMVIDGKALAQGGIHAVWIKESGMRIENAMQWQGQRPWSRAAVEE